MSRGNVAVVSTFPMHCLSTAHTLNSFLESIDTGREVLRREKKCGYVTDVAWINRFTGDKSNVVSKWDLA